MTLGTASSARGEWHLTPIVGLTFLGDTTIVDLEDATGKVHWTYGGAATLLGAGPVGVEGIFLFTPGFFQRDEVSLVRSSRSLALMGNVVLTTPRRWAQYGLRPFLSGGLGLLHASFTEFPPLDVFPVSENLLGYNVGGGATGFITDRTGLRFDLRFFSQLRPGDEGGIAFGRVRLRYWTASVGVAFRL